MKGYFILWSLCLTCFWIGIQTAVADSSSALKNKVSSYIHANDIISANRLLNSNTSLEPDYVIRVLTHNLLKAQSDGNQEAIAYTYLSIGNFWLMRSHNIKAFESFYQAEKISRKEGFDRILALSLMNRSHIENQSEDIVPLLKEAITTFSKLNDTVNLAKANLNLGKTFSNFYLTDSGNKNVEYRDSTFMYYRFARRLNDSIRHPEVEASINVHFAEWFKREHDYSKAIEYYNTAAHFFQMANQAKGQIYCLIELTEMQLTNNQFNDAFANLEKALSWSIRLGFTDYEAEIYELYTSLYEKTGDLKQALDFHRLFIQTRDKIVEAAGQDKIHALNLEYLLAEQNILIESLNHKKRSSRLLLILISSVALLAIIISYLLVHNKRRRLQLAALQVDENRKLNQMQQELMAADFTRQQLEKQLLEEKVKLKTERIIMIANQVNRLDTFLNSINQDVKSLVSNHDIDEMTQKINDLKLSLSQSLHEQLNLRELQVLSTEINQDFFFYISQNFEAISKDDLKLLSYLVMNMTSKEIAGYLKISHDSVNKKRYRLRKKLQIPSGKSFIDFYKETLEMCSQS